MRKLILYIAVVASLATMASCIEDSISTSPADQPAFSSDTIKFGRVFTDEPTPTHSFRVYNRHDKVMQISEIAFAGGGSGYFRINVDGQSGTRFNNIEIRPNDSIYVFVEATLPANGSPLPATIEETLQFVTNGVTSSVIITAEGQDVTRLRAKTIASDTTLTGDQPHQIFDSLVVAPGVTLTLAPGTRLCFHDKAHLTIHGTLISNGTSQAPVVMGGDRTGTVAADIPYEVMSRQWEGVTFTHTSRNNRLEYTTIENTWNGVRLDSISAADPSAVAITLINCRLRNSAGYALEARHSSIAATGTEFAEGGSGVILLHGGSHAINYCSIANYYLFSAIGGPMIQFRHYNADTSDGSYMPWLRAEITNSIIYGSGAELSAGNLDDTYIYLRRCLLGSNGEDDTHFIEILWGSDPMWYTDRSRYIFDYQLHDDSPALGASMPALGASGAPELPATDYYGVAHTLPAAIGAMERKE